MEGKDYELCFGLTASSPRPFLHTLNGQRRLPCWQGWGMFSLPTLWRCTAGAKFVTNIAGEVAVVVSGPKYHK